MTSEKNSNNEKPVSEMTAAERKAAKRNEPLKSTLQLQPFLSALKEKLDDKLPSTKKEFEESEKEDDGDIEPRSIEMSQDEKQFIITQVFETVFREISIQWTNSRSIYDVQEFLSKVDETGTDGESESCAVKWAELCADDYYGSYNEEGKQLRTPQRFFFDSVTLRSEWIAFFVKVFIEICHDLSTIFKNPYEKLTKTEEDSE